MTRSPGSGPQPVQPGRHIVFVHGVQTGGNEEIKGYAAAMQQEIEVRLTELYDLKVNCQEALWSDIVEPFERRAALALNLGGLVLGGATAPAILNEIAHHVVDNEWHMEGVPEGMGQTAVKTAAGELIDKLLPVIRAPGIPSTIISNAMSWVLDIVLYFTDYFGSRIRSEVRDKYLLPGGGGTPNGPLVFAHSLGAVVVLDILREDLQAGRPLSVRRLVTAGTPIGLFQPELDDERLREVEWVNFYDEKDFLTFWNPLSNSGYRSVREGDPISTGFYPVLAHGGYWGNADIISEMVRFA
jgi:hypothetical protein